MLSEKQVIKLLEQPGWRNFGGSYIFKDGWSMNICSYYSPSLNVRLASEELCSFKLTKSKKFLFWTREVLDEQHPIYLAFDTAMVQSIKEEKQREHERLVKKLKEAGIDLE